MKQELKTFYDEENDILYLAREGEENKFVEIQPCVNLEFDKNRQIIGIEIMQASMLLKDVIIPLQTMERLQEWLRKPSAPGQKLRKFSRKSKYLL